MSPEVDAYIGLGSNLDDPARRVEEAMEALGRLPSSRLVAASRRYRNPPMGPQDQPDYVNAVALVATRLGPHELLAELQAIERRFGRVRVPDRRWGPRTLDLDILLYGDQRVDDHRLTIPHPGVSERPFVFVPLLEIAPRVVLPGRGPLAALVAVGDDHRLEPLE